MDPIVIIGSSGHAKVVVDTVQQEGRYWIVGLVDSFRAVGESALGHVVMGSERDMGRLEYEHKLAGYLVAIGDNFARGGVTERVGAVAPDLPLVSAIHPRAVIAAGVSLGPGSVVMAGAVVNPGAVIGRGCIINTSASLDHDASMDAFSSVAPGAAIGGNVAIGSFSAVGIGASVVHRVRIGSHVVVGAGAAVTNDVGDNLIVVGVPARPLRVRAAGDKYL